MGECFRGSSGPGLGGGLAFLGYFQSLLAGLFDNFEEVAALMVVESCRGDSAIAAVALAAFAPRSFCLVPILCMLVYEVVLDEVLE